MAYKAEDNNWYYYKNGKVDFSFTGIASNSNASRKGN
ncbi:hypothetical protein ACTNCE_12385 [Dorea longicatena]